MVDKNSLEDLAQRLIEVNGIIQKLDPSIRVSEFELFKGYLLAGSPLAGSHHSTENSPESGPQPPGLSEMIQSHAQEKPSDNAHLLAAVWFGQYGSFPFGLSAIKECAEAAGLTIPDRLDMTFTSAQEEGKRLYQSAGRGLYKPTVAGELYLKKKYKVTK